jgi:hypothetical protein
MQVKKIALAAVAAIGISGIALAWGTDTIEVADLTVPYKISTGSNTETGVVKYHIYLTRTIHEGGHPAHGFPPEPDTRQCDWNMQGHIDRVVCFTSIMGGTSCNNSLSKNLPIDISGQSGAPSNMFDHRPCSDFIGQINSQTDTLKTQMDTHALIQADLDGDLKSTMQGSGAQVNYGGIS